MQGRGRTKGEEKGRELEGSSVAGMRRMDPFVYYTFIGARTKLTHFALPELSVMPRGTETYLTCLSLFPLPVLCAPLSALCSDIVDSAALATLPKMRC